MDIADKCVFCGTSLLSDEPTTTLGLKGCEGIAKANATRNENISTVPGQVVHTKCRKNFCSTTSISSALKRKSEGCSDESEETPCARRSTTAEFIYQEHCLFCGMSDRYGGKEKSHQLFSVTTLSFQESITQTCNDRNDSWSDTVKGRIEYVNDLPSARVVYHYLCSTNFRTGKQIPQQFLIDDVLPRKKQKCGRPADVTKQEAFYKVVEYLERNDDEQITINDLITKMGEFLDGTDCEAYIFPYMKEKLQKHFGGRIIITEINGKPNVLTL